MTASEHAYSRARSPGILALVIFDVAEESITTYPSKEVARGHSEVVVINPSDARWLVRKA